MTSGLLISGELHCVDGLTIIPPASHGGPEWAALSPGDYTVRGTQWVRTVVIHSTKGIWPQYVVAGSGPGGMGRRVADFWRGDPAHSAAHLVVDTDGTVVCLADLARVVAYHAEGSNPWSVGIEMYQMADGGITEATIKATAKLVDALCWPLFPIPRQMPRGPYRGVPLARMETGSRPAGNRNQLGGPDVVGVIGHRDNTSERGRGDPGDAIWTELAALGFEGLDYAGGEDLLVGKQRQARLNALDAKAGLTWRPLVLDGVCGPASLAAMRRHGFAQWKDVA